MDMREQCLGYKETMRKYFSHTDDRNFHFLKKWERIFLEDVLFKSIMHINAPR